MKSKLFWFFSYEGLRLRQAGAGLTTVTVPTALQRSGDFSATKGGIFDPDTLQNGVRTAFPEQHNSPAANQSAGTGGRERAAAAQCRHRRCSSTPMDCLRQSNDNYSGRMDYMFGPR